MRLIDAEGSELQTQLKIIREAEYQIYGSGSWGFIVKCEHAIEDAPTIQPEPHWIPVTERLPEDDIFVLLTVRRMDDSYNHVPFISTGYISWNHQCWWCAHDGNCKDANVEVLAWMPLPKPFKGVTT